MQAGRKISLVIADVDGTLLTDDKRLKPLGQFTAEGKLTAGYGTTYIFFAGQDDIHGILRYLVQ